MNSLTAADLTQGKTNKKRLSRSPQQVLQTLLAGVSSHESACHVCLPSSAMRISETHCFSAKKGPFPLNPSKEQYGVSWQDLCIFVSLSCSLPHSPAHTQKHTRLPFRFSPCAVWQKCQAWVSVHSLFSVGQPVNALPPCSACASHWVLQKPGSVSLQVPSPLPWWSHVTFPWGRRKMTLPQNPHQISPTGSTPPPPNELLSLTKAQKQLEAIPVL